MMDHFFKNIPLKIISLLCWLLISHPVNAQQIKPDSNFHVYLLIGQSNMAGRGAVDEESKKINKRILMLDSFNNWVPATDPVHFDKPTIAGVGPGISFANEMLQDNDKITIGLIPCAWGGSPIKAWQPGEVYLITAHPYDDAIKRTAVATQRGVLKGILWHQGESDNDTAKSVVYLDKLKELIKRLRNDLHQPQLPFVAGEIGYFNKEDHINSIIDQLPQVVPVTAVAGAKDLTDKGDHLHFNTASARELGKRYAAAMKQLQQTNTKR